VNKKLMVGSSSVKVYIKYDRKLQIFVKMVEQTTTTYETKQSLEKKKRESNRWFFVLSYVMLCF